uniref:Uncharacterized protein n=1 Tax=Leersia perrieri TaxID=77586 RepID=A0A0D9XWF2_9ORYZ
MGGGRGRARLPVRRRRGGRSRLSGIRAATAVLLGLVGRWRACWGKRRHWFPWLPPAVEARMTQRQSCCWKQEPLKLLKF